MNDPDAIYYGGQVWEHKRMCSWARVVSLDAERFVLVNMESDGGGMAFHLKAAPDGVFASFDALKAELSERWTHVGDSRELTFQAVRA